MEILIFCFLLLVLFIIVLLNRKTKSKERKTKSKIPKTIWTYWHDITNIPPVVKACIESWKKHNSDYKITILNNNLVKKLCNVDIDKLNIPKAFNARYADYARLLVLHKYGGIWMDSTIICTESLKWVDDLQNKTSAELIGYIAPSTSKIEHPIPENWFFACIPKSKFVKDWLNEALFMNSFPSENEYINHVGDLKKYNAENLKDLLPYLIMHLCASIVLHRYPTKYHIHLMDTIEGPFKYLFKNNWELPKSIQQLCLDKELQTNLIKLRGKERRYIEENSEYIVCKKEDVNSDIYKVIKIDNKV